MHITILTENTTADDRLTAEHGLSIYLEQAERRVLFDMGQTDAFAANAAILGVDLAAVDTAVLSHGHYDHGGGLATFLNLNSHATVYLQPTAFEPHYHGTEKYIGLNTALEHHPRLCKVGDRTDLGDGMTLLTLGNAPLAFSVDAHGLTKRCGDTFIPDPFTHEHYLLIEHARQRILISGCSHKGVLNLLDRFHPDVFIGGFHFMKLDPDGDGRPVLETAAAEMASRSCRYYTCHCTGDAAFAFLKRRLGDRLDYIRTGNRVDIII